MCVVVGFCCPVGCSCLLASRFWLLAPGFWVRSSFSFSSCRRHLFPTSFNKIFIFITKRLFYAPRPPPSQLLLPLALPLPRNAEKRPNFNLNLDWTTCPAGGSPSAESRTEVIRMKRFLVAKFLAWIFIFFIFYSAQGEKFSWDSTSRQTVYENIFHFSFYYFISLNLIAHGVFFFFFPALECMEIIANFIG